MTSKDLRTQWMQVCRTNGKLGISTLVFFLVACASSLLAVDCAVHALQTGACDAALVGGMLSFSVNYDAENTWEREKSSKEKTSNEN